VDVSSSDVDKTDYKSAIEYMLAETAGYINVAMMHDVGGLKFRLKDVKEGIGGLYLLCVSVLDKYRTAENQEAYDKLIKDTTDFLDAPLPVTHAEGKAEIRKARDLYMRYSHEMVKLNVVRV
jgi:hypothetical protein